MSNDLGSASEQLMALGPAPELEPLRAHMTVDEYEALVSMLERRIAELEAALLDEREACAKMLDDKALEYSRLRDPGLANLMRQTAKQIRTGGTG